MALEPLLTENAISLKSRNQIIDELATTFLEKLHKESRIDKCGKIGLGPHGTEYNYRNWVDTLSFCNELELALLLTTGADQNTASTLAIYQKNVEHYGKLFSLEEVNSSTPLPVPYVLLTQMMSMGKGVMKKIKTVEDRLGITREQIEAASNPEYNLLEVKGDSITRVSLHRTMYEIFGIVKQRIESPPPLLPERECLLIGQGRNNHHKKGEDEISRLAREFMERRNAVQPRDELVPIKYAFHKGMGIVYFMEVKGPHGADIINESLMEQLHKKRMSFLEPLIYRDGSVLSESVLSVQPYVTLDKIPFGELIQTMVRVIGFIIPKIHFEARLQEDVASALEKEKFSLTNLDPNYVTNVYDRMRRINLYGLMKVESRADIGPFHKQIMQAYHQVP